MRKEHIVSEKKSNTQKTVKLPQWQNPRLKIKRDLWSSQVALMMKNPPTSARDGRDMGSIPRSERSPGEGMATHSNIFAWRIPWTEQTDGLQSIGQQRVRHNKLLSLHAQCLVTKNTSASYILLILKMYLILCDNSLCVFLQIWSSVQFSSVAESCLIV